MRHVELVVQVVGYTKIPLVPKKGPDLITWYQKVRRPHFFACSPCPHTLINISTRLSSFRMIMSSVMRVKFLSDMGDLSLQVRSSIRSSALILSSSFQRGTKACEAYATSSSSDSNACPQHPRFKCSPWVALIHREYWSLARWTFGSLLSFCYQACLLLNVRFATAVDTKCYKLYYHDVLAQHAEGYLQ